MPDRPVAVFLCILICAWQMLHGICHVVNLTLALPFDVDTSSDRHTVDK